MAGPWEKYRGPQMVAANPMFPGQMQGQQLNNQGQGLQNQHTAAETARIPIQNANTQVSTEQNRQQLRYNSATTAATLFDKFTTDPTVKAYREVLPQVAQAMSSPPGGPNDISVVYAWAKAMDPTGSVRDQDVKLGQSAVGPLQQAKFMVSQYHLEKGGQLPPEVKVGLIEAMRNKARQLDRQYSQVRANFIKQAKGASIPTDIFGAHEGDLYRATEEQYIKDHGGTPKVNGVPIDGKAKADPELSGRLDAMIKSGASYDDAVTFAKGLGVPPPDRNAYNKAVSFAKAHKDYKGPLGVVEAPAQDGTYANSFAGQGLSGANEGMASVLGAPADLARTAINLVPQGINAVANTNIPTLPEPIAGSQWFKDRLTDVGSIQAPSEDTSKQFVRRVGQSVGAAAVPAGAAGSLGKLAAGLLGGLGGGLGGATAQLVAPGNPVMELLGEIAGGGLTGFGLAKTAQRSAQRQIEAKVPTIADLKNEASGLYRKAETRGVAATPKQTRQLAADVTKTLLDEGQLGPNGKITDANTNTSKAYNLIQQYAGKQMKPKEMNTVRKVLSDSRKSPDASDRRLGNILLDQIDSFVEPLAPEFGQARSVASRYLQAEDLDEARRLAAVKAGQFTGSGLENALRSQYRGLDSDIEKGRAFFTPEVAEAIRKVSRGTPVSNTLRGLGKLAPTGVVSGGLGSFLPGFGVASMFGGPAGVAAGGTLASLGIGGRIGATRMGIRAADEAELIARNGGKLPQAPMLPKSLGEYVAYLMAAQAPKYGDSPER
jgi:hypothetical protein